jgi:hypothetical protein
MTETTELPPLSPATQASVQGLARAKNEVRQWTHNLEQALADDVREGRLTPELAATIARTHEVKAPPKPGDKAEAQETTAEANQAQLDAQTKAAEAEAAKVKPAPAPAKPKDEDDDKPPAKAEDKKPAPTSHTSR